MGMRDHFQELFVIPDIMFEGHDIEIAHQNQLVLFLYCKKNYRAGSDGLVNPIDAINDWIFTKQVNI